MSDRWSSYIRTMWPLFLGHLAALLVSFVATRFGYELDGALAFEAVGFAAAALVYWVGRQLENSSVPVLKTLGKFVMSLGLTIPQPTYVPPPPLRPAAAMKLPPPPSQRAAH